MMGPRGRPVDNPYRRHSASPHARYLVHCEFTGCGWVYKATGAADAASLIRYHQRQRPGHLAVAHPRPGGRWH